MDLSNASDDRLLALMGQKNDRYGFEAAWVEFHRRHSAYLYRVCLKACRHGDRHEGARDLANATFKRVLEAKARFAPPDGVTAEVMSRLVRAWLGRIATRLAADEARVGCVEEPIHLGHEEWQDIRERPEGAASQSTPEVYRILSEELDEREQDVIRTSFMAYDPDRENQKRSTDDVQTLAAKWNTTPENIRQIRKRALDKLRKAIPARRSVASGEGVEP